MKLKEYQTTSKNADFLITKFLENPGKFASIVLQMYWDAKKERDELIMSNHKVIQDNTKLKRKLDDVVDLFNTHLYHKKAWSDNPYYDRVQQRLNKILEGYPLKATRLRRLYSTEIEQALKNKDLSECLFLLEKIKMDLEEDE
ncbi:hypothetical protein P3K44_05085 [Staphylococcus pseudintermedius]|uniref:hypothetical protein n=1 Tax=Staphylococcus pseudintermedius TaxID=283734 RepID=UPI0038576243